MVTYITPVPIISNRSYLKLNLNCVATGSVGLGDCQFLTNAIISSSLFDNRLDKKLSHQ